MRVELINLDDGARFAGASHITVARALLGDSGLIDDTGPTVRFDARYIGHVALILGWLHEFDHVRADGVVVASREADAEDNGFDVDGLHATDTAFGRARVERAYVDHLLRQLQGVTLHDPARIWIEHDVVVDPGATLWPGVILRGTTHVGAAEIGPGAVLTDTRVADGAVIKPYCVCDGAHVGPDSSVGPMAHLRPKAKLSVGVKVGNFVEVKNTLLHPGAKASHLTYLGDAEIGAEANIGAGTITCNYDGYNKWKTVIGEGAFIGSNSALVAPVKIDAGAIVAAGSTINQDVPADALALGRADQRNIPKMAERIRRKNQSIKERGRG